MSTINPTYPLTPSEIAFLKAEEFVKTTRLGFRLVHSENKVNANDLGRTVLSAGLLAMEALGELQIEIEEYKRLIGKGRRIKLTPLTERSSFPTPSLEANLYGWCGTLATSGESVTVKDLIYAWLESDDNNPWSKVLNTLSAYLADRNLFGRSEEKKLKIFTVVNYEMLDETRKLAEQAPVAEVQALLTAFEKDREDIWKQLTKEINQGVGARDSSDDDIDLD